MKILGIQDGHNAGAALLHDGKIISAISEERISRLKNDPGYPRKAIEKVLEITNTAPKDIDIIALATKFLYPREFYLGWDWYNRDYKDQIKDEIAQFQKKAYFAKRLQERKKTITEHLGVASKKIAVIEHHASHAAAAYFGSPWALKEKVLVLTADGSGDGICATVSIGEKGKITRLATTPSDASLGKIYSRVTYLLGMRPWEHEYKVMGLAPYADEKGTQKVFAVLSELIGLSKDGLAFQCKTKLSTNYCYPYLREKLERYRFDWIAGGAQRLTEELMVKWVANAIKKTGIRKLACGGGVFMNVKTNKRILELDEVQELFVFPSCGDESLSIGAAYQAYSDYWLKRKKLPKKEALGQIYLGPEFSHENIKKALAKEKLGRGYNVEQKENINDAVSRLLAKGAIVARLAGGMEWGARSLGNRSILMDPRNRAGVKELNAAIKQRDFWMPFAPTILYERRNDYLVNPKKARAPYMILAFQTTKRGGEDLAAALHPYDLTARPQILEKYMNPDYYDLIQRFETITGVGALLNTSFNLHGEPVVHTPEDALSTFKRSGLRFLAMGNYLIRKT